MFPAHAGMNRARSGKAKSSLNVPRTRGDEPQMDALIGALKECSPHTRG